MNSVISAFKAKKNSSNNAASEKQHNGSTGGGGGAVLRHDSTSASSASSKKKAINAQDNGYQYLRHIREIDTATKMLSPVVVVADEFLEADMLNFRPLPQCVDVVDHAAAAGHLTPTIDATSSAADCNMNGASKCMPAMQPMSATQPTENGNCNDICESVATPTNGQVSPTQHLDAEDDESEHSTAACTSSSSEHSNSTVVRSPQVPPQQQQQQPSPAKSLSLSLSSTSSSSSSSSSASSTSASIAICNSGPSSCSSSTSCDVTTIAASPSSSTPTLSSLSAVSVGGNAAAPSSPSSPTAIGTSNVASSAEYVPAFLKSAPITLPIIMPNGSSGLASMPPHQLNSGNGTPANSAATTPKHTRYSKPRLSLSRFINHSMPSVHGRPSLSVPGAANGSAVGANGAVTNPPKRISTHQRNLSLDFRSMGILLPPVSQVTNTRINLTQHHRNRSLDSALQRIPEVEVSSPNAESENTFCTPSILGTTMCSKIATTAANVTAALTITTTPALTSAPPASSSAVSGRSSLVAAAVETDSFGIASTTEQPTASGTLSQAVNPSVIVELCPALRSRPKSSETPASVARASTVSCNGSSSNNNGSSKKREDLTSLGSDDSGIICGSESDQISLNRIRHSHESLDSGEMDAEEECIDMLETTSMDEEYGMLQSDLCFYQSPDTDCQTLRPSRKKSQNHTTLQKGNENGDADAHDCHAEDELNERLRYREMNMSQAAINIERIYSETPTESMDAETPTADVVDACSTPSNTSAVSVVSPTTAATLASGPGKAQNEVLFKSFFGATKNAIFRTAQSIIENHEKKNAAKNKSDESGATAPQDQVKSPTDISKKKEFFGLITSNASKKAAAAAAAAAAASSASSTPVDTPCSDTASINLKSPTTAEAEKSADSICTERTLSLHLPGGTSVAATTITSMSKSASISSLNKLKVPGMVKCFIKERPNTGDAQQKTEKGPSGLLRFFESPVFNIHFAVHYLFYSKEPGVLSFIGNKIFSFPDQEVDLYIPQLIVMYIQMDELAEVLDPYLTIRCRKSVDFSLKCLWLLEAYNYQVETLGNSGRKSQLALMKEIFSKKERKILSKHDAKDSAAAVSPMAKKTHHRSQSDATVLLSDSRRYPSSGALSISNRLYQQPPYTTQTLPATPAKLCLGDLTSGRAFDNGCTCFETVRGQVNGLLGQKTFCSCGAPKTAPQKEFMKALINVGKNLTQLPSKAEKTSALRMFLNLINKNLPARVWLPLYSDIPHHVVRITEEKTAVLNSKDKTPYIIYVEVVEVPDIYSSPLIPKMMPSLRHTKSEEHLDGVCVGQLHHASCSRTSSCSSHGTSCRLKKDKLISESSTVSTSEVPPAGAASTTATTATATDAAAMHSQLSLGGLHLTEDDVWSQEDDEITAQYLNMRKISERDAISQMSLDSCDSRDQGIPVLFNIGDVRTRHCNNLTCENTKSFSNDPEDPSAAALKEPWHEKEQQIRGSSPYGHLSNWRLLSAIVKCGDDLRQELMATQLLQMFKIIWQEENVDLWVRPYKIVCLSNDSGLIEPILNTVSLHQIKKNSNKSLRDYFIDEYGASDGEGFRLAQKNFVQSCAAYCLISYLLQVKDRHNGNILLHSDGHIIHIDFGFILSISPKNLGFEQSPFKLTPEFVDVMGGTSSEHWKEFNRLLLVGMMSARKHMDRIINFVEIMRSNAQLPCFKNGCSGTVQNLRKRFHMNLTEQEMERKVEQLVQDSLKSLSTKLYDGYQYYTNGIL